jgi:Tfp pilus assembly protein PilV
MEIRMSRNRTKNSAKQQGGFSLLETAVAMVVMMIGGLGIAAVFSYAIKNNNGSRDRAIAIAVAQQEIERLRSLPFNDAALTATPALQTPTTVYNAGGRFSMSTTIVDTTPSFKTIQIRVTPVRSDAWATSSVQVTTERAAFTLGPFVGGP